jgi:glutathione S-transferase
MMTLTKKPVLYGAPYSVYVRAVRLALREKAVGYELVPVDIFAAGGVLAEHQARHPFGKIPMSLMVRRPVLKPAQWDDEFWSD